jgi:hypothetical protein
MTPVMIAVKLSIFVGKVDFFVHFRISVGKSDFTPRSMLFSYASKSITMELRSNRVLREGIFLRQKIR